MTKTDLFIGIPVWNSEAFLEVCLRQIEETCRGVSYRVGVLDNESVDGTVAIAKAHGCKVESKKLALPDALNELASWSKGRYTLLMHADTILLNPKWFDLCVSKLAGNCALVSPQDIGCGPFTRPWGVGKPESSFMLFRTGCLREIRNRRWVRRFRLRVPRKVVNFYARNITHFLPTELERRNLAWYPMRVHVSRTLDHQIYEPDERAKYWTEELGYLEYGLGNFYSVDYTITHYHNWYDRILNKENATEMSEEFGIPVEYILERSRKFLADLDAGILSLPDVSVRERVPRALPIHKGYVGAEALE